MKAKIKETGEWITVDTCNEGFYDVETHDIYEPEELILSDGSEWTIFKREVAKGILYAIVQHDGFNYHDPDQFTTDAVTAAVCMADALIQKLK